MTMTKTLLVIVLALACGAANATEPALPVLSPFEQSEKAKALMTAEIERLTLEKQLRDLQAEATKREESALPILIGIVSEYGGLVAEFADERGVRTIRPGDTLRRGWTVSRVRDRHVELVHLRRGRTQNYVMRMGAPNPELAD